VKFFFANKGVAMSEGVLDYTVGCVTELNLDSSSFSVYVSAPYKLGYRGILYVNDYSLILFLENGVKYKQYHKSNVKEGIFEVNVNTLCIHVCDLLKYDGASSGNAMLRVSKIRRILPLLNHEHLKPLEFAGGHRAVREFSYNGLYDSIVFMRLQSIRSPESDDCSQYTWANETYYRYRLLSLKGMLVTSDARKLCKSSDEEGVHTYDGKFNKVDDVLGSEIMSEFECIRTFLLSRLCVADLVNALDGNCQIKFSSVEEFVECIKGAKGDIEYKEVTTELVSLSLEGTQGEKMVVSKGERCYVDPPLPVNKHKYNYDVFKVTPDRRFVSVAAILGENFKIVLNAGKICFTIKNEFVMAKLGKLHKSRMIRWCLYCSCEYCMKKTVYYADFRIFANRSVVRKQRFFSYDNVRIMQMLTEDINDYMRKKIVMRDQPAGIG